MRCNTKYDILIHADALDNQGAGVHVYLVQFLNHLHKHSNLKCILLRSSKNKNYPKWKEIGIGMSPVALLWKALRMFVCIPYLARKYKVAYVLEPAHF